MKNKILSINIILILLFTSLISVNAAAPSPRVDLNDYELTVTDINNVYIGGTVSIAKGQNIGLFDSTGKTPLSYTTVKNTGSISSFKIYVPAFVLKNGNNTFQVISLPVRGALNASSPKTFTVKVKTASSKQDQTITANDVSLKVNETKNLNAKVTSGLPLTYKSNDPNIATVDANGMIVGRKIGTTNVTINQAGNNEYNPTSKVIFVTVKENTHNIQKYIITYNANGGKGTMSNQTVNEGSAIVLKNNKFTRTGYTFKGWATKKNGPIVYKNQQSIKIESNITLYAVWKNNKVFLNKNVLVLGDSIQAGFGKYAVTAAKGLGAKKVTNKSVGGRTVSYIKGKASKTNSILYQLKHDSWYKKNVKNYKYVIIAAGTNDYSWGVISANKLQKDTVSTINYLRKYNKDSIIIIVTPLHRWAGKSYIKGVEKYRQKMAAAAKGYKNIYVIDGKTIVKKNESKYFADYVHPKTTFAKKTLAPRLITQIQNKLI